MSFAGRWSSRSPRFVLAVLFVSMISGCELLSDSVPQPPLQPISAEQAQDARAVASSIVGGKGQALYVCGQSDGVGLFSAKWGSGFTPDGMKDGRLVFLIRDDGRPDVLFRDATGQTLSSLDDGAQVERIAIPEKKIESWIISHISNGIVETHNITEIPQAGLVDLWTSNKPTSLIGASAKLFRSSCVRS